MDFSDKSLKAQLKRADRLGAPYVLIVGENELEQGSAILRDMQTKKQVSVPFDDIVVQLMKMVRQ
jgi:histidyl-tRNA synthetase